MSYGDPRIVTITYVGLGPFVEIKIALNSWLGCERDYMYIVSLVRRSNKPSPQKFGLACTKNHFVCVRFIICSLNSSGLFFVALF